MKVCKHDTTLMYTVKHIISDIEFTLFTSLDSTFIHNQWDESIKHCSIQSHSQVLIERPGMFTSPFKMTITWVGCHGDIIIV